MFAGYYNVFLSKMQKSGWQYKTKVELLLNEEEMHIYLNSLMNNSPFQDEFSEWCVNVKYKE